LNLTEMLNQVGRKPLDPLYFAFGGVTLCTMRPRITLEFGAESMSGFSRGPEIRRRRTRKEKIVRLRKRYAMSTSDAEKKAITAKLHRLALASPGQPLMKT
jgi:hypothetical protein